MGFHVNAEQFDTWLTEQQKTYDTCAPKCFPGGNTFSDVDPNRCVSCGACVRKCEKKSVGALTMQNYRPIRDAQKCIGCGKCVINCPNRAWTRSEKKYYRLTLLGRTGKKNPRLGEDFIKWADEDSIIRIILNTYDYVIVSFPSEKINNFRQISTKNRCHQSR